MRGNWHAQQNPNLNTAAPNGAWTELEVIKFSDMRAQLDGRPLVKGYLQHEQISLIVGDPSSGKTFLALDRDLHIAAGLEWFGRKVSQGPVVYLAAEAGQTIQNRAVAWGQEHGLNNTGVPFAAITSPVDLCHADAGDIDKIVEAVANLNFASPLALLEIDTVARVMAGGNENAPDDMGAFIHSLDLLRQRLRCHISAVHHFGKEHDRGARGHNSLLAAIDTETRIENKVAVITKQRDGPCGGEFPFKLRPVTLGYDEDGDLVTTCVVDSLNQSTSTANQNVRHKLPVGCQVALDTLDQAMSAHAIVPEPTPTYVPPHTPVVKGTLWQVFYIEKERSSGQDVSVIKHIWRRHRKELLCRQIIGAYGEMVWRIEGGGQRDLSVFYKKGGQRGYLILSVFVRDCLRNVRVINKRTSALYFPVSGRTNSPPPFKGGNFCPPHPP
jgi:hypothetical protein